MESLKNDQATLLEKMKLLLLELKIESIQETPGFLTLQLDTLQIYWLDYMKNERRLETLLKGPTQSYKNCIVPFCTSTTAATPDKLFFCMPKEARLRKQWCEAMNRTNDLSLCTGHYCCEDHFDIENDTDHNMKYKLKGCKSLKIKKGVVPHKFKCQQNMLPTSRIKKAPKPCSSCLSYGRELKPLGDLTEIYSTLVPGVEKVKELKVCWECRGVLRRCASFQRQAKRAQDTLTLEGEKKHAKITDNSFSLSHLTKVEVANVSIDSEMIPSEHMIAVNVNTNVQKDEHDPLALEVESNAMNTNTTPKNRKRKKDGNNKEVSATSKVTDVISVEIEMPAVQLEEQEPLCEIEDIKMEIEDPLEDGREENDLNASTEEIKTQKIKDIKDKKRKHKRSKKNY